MQGSRSTMCWTNARLETRPQRPAPRKSVRAGGRFTFRWWRLSAALVAGLAAWTLKPDAVVNPLPVARLTLLLPPGDTVGVTWPSVALSPDGRRLAYRSRGASASQLFVRPIDSLDVTPLAGTEGAISPFFSPDVDWLLARGQLKKVLAAGGGLQILCDAAGGFGGSWGADDTSISPRSARRAFGKFPPPGASPWRSPGLAVGNAGRGESPVAAVLADGKAGLFASVPALVGTRPSSCRWKAANDASSVRGASTGRYMVSGHLLYAGAEELVTVPFDFARLLVTGPPVT